MMRPFRKKCGAAIHIGIDPPMLPLAATRIASDAACCSSAYSYTCASSLLMRWCVLRLSWLLLPAFLASGGSRRSLASQIPESALKVGRSTIQIKFSKVVPQEYRQLIQNWVSDGAEAVASVYDRFPVSRLTVTVRVTRGMDVADGVTFDGRLIRISVGEGVTKEILREDWRMTHEMFHLGFPTTDDGRDWMGEGVSTYAEPFARARAGQMSEEEVWRGFIEGFPNGLPRRNDRGLDRTPTWGRTYWGGALFWLMAAPGDPKEERKS